MYGVNVIDGLEEEAIETARAWSKLGEPHRSALREMILAVAAESDRDDAADETDVRPAPPMQAAVA